MLRLGLFPVLPQRRCRDEQKITFVRNKIGCYRQAFSFVCAVFGYSCAQLDCFYQSRLCRRQKYASIFTNEKYVQSLYGDVKQYAYDMCAQNGIPTDSVDEVITYDAVYNTVNAYAVGNFDNSQDYTKTTYEDRISELNTQLAQKQRI